jgi:hypothetical protein
MATLKMETVGDLLLANVVNARGRRPDFVIDYLTHPEIEIAGTNLGIPRAEKYFRRYTRRKRCR